MQWAVLCAPASWGSMGGTEARPRISAAAMAACIAVAGCDATYDRGIATASQLVTLAGVETAPHEITARFDPAFGAGFRDSAFARMIREAVLDYPALASQQARMESAAARMDGLVGSLRPQLSSGLSAGQDVLGADGGPTVDARITVRQLVFDGAATRNRIAVTSINLRQLSFELDTLLSRLSRDMATAALDLWRQTALLTLAEEDVAAHETFVAQTQERAQGGVIAESDLLSARSRLADARARLARAGSGVAQARASYTALIGPVPQAVARPPAPPALPASAARDRIVSSSQMSLARLRVAEARGQRNVARSGRYPGVFLQVTGARTDVFGEAADNDVFAGFSVDYDFSDGGQQRALEREADSALAAAESGLQTAERELLRSLDVALANREAFAFEAEAAASAVEFNQATLDAVREQFGIGRRNIVHILDAQRDLTAARTRQVEVDAGRIAAELAILELTGDLAGVFGIDYDPLEEIPGGLAPATPPSRAAGR